MHPYYVSMTEIHHRATEGKLEIAVRIFTDDFEQAVRGDCQCKVDLSAAPNANTGKLLHAYIQKHLHVKIAGGTTDQALTYLGYEKEEESTWVYLESSSPKNLTGLQVRNDLLYERHKAQINMVRAVFSGKDKTQQVRFPESLLEF
jgi:hypothetical protein